MMSRVESGRCGGHRPPCKLTNQHKLVGGSADSRQAKLQYRFNLLIGLPMLTPTK